MSTPIKHIKGQATYTISNITFPPLLTEPVAINNNTMIGIKGKVRVYAENTYYSVSENYIDVAVVESYNRRDKLNIVK